MRKLRWYLLTGSILLLSTGGCPFAYGQTPGANEYEVRAAIIVNLVRFVTWPHGRGNDAHTPFVVGLMGANEQTSILEGYLVTHLLDGRSFSIRKLRRADRCDDCQLVYVTRTERRHFEELAGAFSAAGTLTVSDDETFACTGGIVGLPLLGEKIEIQINLSEAEHSNLTISSRLLSLAKVIRKGCDR